MEDGHAAAPTGGEGNVDGIDTSKTDARRRNFASSAPLAVSARAVDALTSRATRWFALRWKEANGSESSNGSGSGSLRRGLAAVWIVCFIAPLEALRRCTIPNASAKKYNAFYATCNVFLSPLLLLHLARDVVIPLDRPVMYVPGSGSTGLTRRPSRCPRGGSRCSSRAHLRYSFGDDFILSAAVGSTTGRLRRGGTGRPRSWFRSCAPSRGSRSPRRSSSGASPRSAVPSAYPPRRCPCRCSRGATASGIWLRTSSSRVVGNRRWRSPRASAGRCST